MEELFKDVKSNISPTIQRLFPDGISYDRIRNLPNYDDCKKLDKQIKLLDVFIASSRKKLIQNNTKARSKQISILEEVRSQRQAKFINLDCANKIENIKAQETAGIIGKEIEKYEDDVLSGSGKEQKQLFIIGGVVILVALGIIMYSTKKK